MVTSLKKKIKNDIKNSTYIYYKDTDIYFCDYIYGDQYYVTLEDVIYRYITTYDVDWEFEYTLENIDIDQLVNDLYLHYIKSDKMFSNNYAGKSERYRKNYIMKSLRNATEPLLIKQFKENKIIAQELQELNNPKNFHYISIYAQEGRLLEDISYKQWKNEKSESSDITIKREQLEKIFTTLNPMERKVVYLIIKNRSHEDIAKILNIEQADIRKFLYFAKEKLKEQYNWKRLSA